MNRTGLLLFLLFACISLHAQGGPPLLTDDPGTPGNRQWEINIGATAELQRDFHDFELPLADFNYGWGDHTQLKFEIPWLVRSADAGKRTELGDGKVGVKWRFVDQEKHGVNISTYPQLSWNSPGPKRLVDRGNQLLLPIEIAKAIGKIELNAEVGYNLKEHGVDELLFGWAAAYEASSRLELLGELHSVQLRNLQENESVFQLGGRQKLSARYVLLFAAGRRLPGSSGHEPGFVGYFGLQFLLGRARPTEGPSRADTKQRHPRVSVLKYLLRP